MQYDFDVVGKIGSMALIRKEDNDIDYNIFARLGAELRPGVIWVSSGAAEIGRVDYIKRSGQELEGNAEEVKTDYAAQGQSILMENYRRFISPQFSVRQVLVEHQHFNDPAKREHIRRLLLRAAQQNAVPIVNYNDPVSDEETRKFELQSLRSEAKDQVVECVDNDETAAVVSGLVRSRYLVILSNVEGIYRNAQDPSTLVRELLGSDPEQVVNEIRALQKHCVGASRPGANGAWAKLEFTIAPVQRGTTVIIGHGRHKLSDLLAGRVPCTRIGFS